MPKITHFIYCLSSIASDEKTDVSGILSAITPSHIPGDFSFSILCSIMNLSDGFHDIEVKFLSPSKKVLAKLDGVAAGATKVEASTTPGNIKVNGTETPVVTIATDEEVTEMLAEIFPTA